MKLFYPVFLFILLSCPGFAQDIFSEYSPDVDINNENSISYNNIDSINALADSAVSIINQKVNKLDTIDLSGLSGRPALLTDSINALQSVVSDSVGKIQHAVDGFLHQASPDLQAPGGQLPEMKSAGLTDQSIPGVNIPENPAGDLGGDLPGLNLPEANLPENIPDLGEKNVNPDQIINDKAAKVDAVKELREQTGMGEQQLKGMTGKPEGLEKYGNTDQYKSMANQEAMEKMNTLFEQHSDKLEAAQNQMNKLKKKYSYVPNSNDLSTAVKINSLEEAPLKERIIIGANLKFERGNPLSLDFAPLVMYKINRVFHAGVSGSYRASIGYDEKNYSTNPQDVIGASALARHFVLKSFFAYSEFEYRSSTFRYDGQQWNSISGREWVPGLLAGAGKEMSLAGKLKGTVILTYDFLHSDNSFSRSPWNVKIGFHLDGLDLKGRRKDYIGK